MPGKLKRTLRATTSSSDDAAGELRARAESDAALPSLLSALVVAAVRDLLAREVARFLLRRSVRRK